MRAVRAITFRLSLLCLAGISARAETTTGRFLPSDSSVDSVGKIPGLEWVKKEGVPVVLEEKDGETQSLALLDGLYTQGESSLIWESERIRPNEKGSFQLKIPVKSKAVVFELLAVSDEGEIQREVFRLLFQSWEPPPKKSPLGLSAGAGPTLISYDEVFKRKDVARFSIVALTVKTAYQRSIFFPHLQFGANLFFTAFSLGSPPSGSTVRFLGANVRVGYTLPVPRAPWKVTLSLGLYYARMFVSGAVAVFGFQDLLFPHIYPTLSREISPKDSATLYLKFVPLGQSFFSIDSSERELAVGLGWNRRLDSGKNLIFGFDYSNLRFLSGVNRAYGTSALGLSISYGW